MARPRTFEKEKVLEAATHVFWEKGYDNTSIPDLESATGLVRTSLYAAFGNKQNLYVEALKQYQKKSFEYLKASLSQEGNPIEQISLFLKNSMKMACSDPNGKGCFITNAGTDKMNQCGETKQLLEKNKKKIIKLYKEKLREAQKSKLLNPTKDVKKLASFIYIIQIGLASAQKSGASKTDLYFAIDQCIASLTN